MANYGVITDETLTAIADAIRTRGVSGSFTPAQMAQAILDIPSAPITLTNLIPDISIWSGSYADSTSYKSSTSIKLPAGSGIKMTSITTTAQPVLNHKYYMCGWFKSDGAVSAGDGRFEWYAGDGEGYNWTIPILSVNSTDWQLKANYFTANPINGSGHFIRNFTVNPQANLWCNGLMLVDLTAGFGEGKEPDTTWCIDKIPYFVGSQVFTSF